MGGILAGRRLRLVLRGRGLSMLMRRRSRFSERRLREVDGGMEILGWYGRIGARNRVKG